MFTPINSIEPYFSTCTVYTQIENDTATSVYQIIRYGANGFLWGFEQILPIWQVDMKTVKAGFSIQTLLFSLSSDAVLMATPILCVMPYTSAFLDEYKSGYLKEYLPRTTKKSHVKSKVIATTISGGLVLFVGILITYVVLGFGISIKGQIKYV